MLISVILTLVDSSNEQRFQLLDIFGLVPDLAPSLPTSSFIRHLIWPTLSKCHQGCQPSPLEQEGMP